MTTGNQQYPVWRHTTDASGKQAVSREVDQVVREEPLEVRVAGRGVGVTMRTPGHDAELALGFLIGEGVIARPADVAHVRRCDQSQGDVIDVLVTPGVAVDFARLTRHVFASSSCGLCGSATVDSVRKQFPPIARADSPTVTGADLHAMAERLRAGQHTFDKTGGLHAAALFDAANGNTLIATHEDIGRHNAVDKVVGAAFTQGRLPLSGCVLLVSGRVSFEIVQKALAAGVPIVAAVSAPSSLAIDLAAESGVTLAGFLRPGRFNVYTHPQRIVGTAPLQTGASPTATTL